ncbi:MAG: NACHT domain-containing protein, partial [Verrucomicrobiota bacterium]
MSSAKLGVSQLPLAIKPVLKTLGEIDGIRLQALLLHFRGDSEATAPLDQCCAAAFPNDTPDSALENFRKLRGRINSAAKKAALPGQPPLSLETDRFKGTPAPQRTVWFTGPDPAITSATILSHSSTAEVHRQRTLVDQHSQPYLGFDQRTAEFYVFVSYSQKDTRWVEPLISDLQTQLARFGHYRFHFWMDRRLSVGEEMDPAIQEHLHRCHFGLLMISPHFLESEYIWKHEAPHFVGSEATKPCFPVGISELDFANLHPIHPVRQSLIKSLQIYLLEEDHGARKHWYTQSGGNQKQRFAEQLSVRMERRIHDNQVLLQPTAEEVMSRFSDQFACENFPEGYQPPRAAPFGLEELSRKKDQIRLEDRGTDALELLKDWLADPEAPPFLAVLGEYGMGKTTVLQRLTQDLLQLRKEDPSLPLPIFIDLKKFVHDRNKTSVPTLDEILTDIIARAWPYEEGTPSITTEDIIRLAHEQKALVIFDGLDEKIIHLTQDEAASFINALWGVLPPAKPGQPIESKLILSCRSHYFPDLVSQQGLLTGNDRHGIRTEDYRACIMLPFQEEQIRGYFTSLFGEDQAGPFLDLVDSIHNLRDLAQRPYLLSLIADDIEWLENQRATGKTVTAITLYDRFTERWLDRDTGKHIFTKTDKRRMMEDLAAALWKSGAKAWKWSRVEEWLATYLPTLANHESRYKDKERDVLDQDLRTATFFPRPDDSADELRF